MQDPRTPPAAVAETHSGIVFFVGDRAYKAKKPVDLGFLDFSTVEARRRACRRELTLNRRLAPDVYLGIAELSGPERGRREPLLVMRRLPDDRRLSTLALAAHDLDDEVREIASRLAAFHDAVGAPPEARASATVGANVARWRELAESVRVHGPAGQRARVDGIEELALRYLRGRGALFDERIVAGRARDGHGDLLADDIFLLDDGVRILDCLDFDDGLRCGDVLADISFLAMDLDRLGRTDLASLLLDHYRTLAGDDWPASLAHHYQAQRALVRASVSWIRAEQGDASAASAAPSLLALAQRHLEAGTVQLVVVSGLPGTGKSTVATAVADRLGGELLRSDEVRRQFADSDLHPRYAERQVDRTYGELLSRARWRLARGRSVVLDATWRTEDHRLAVEHLADDVTANLVVLECRAPSDVADQRIARRAAAGGDPSEATVEVAERMRCSWHPWTRATAIDTSSSVESATAAALAVMGIAR